MNNLAYKQTPEYKYVKKAFIDKGFERDKIKKEVVFIIFCL
ncbi:Bdr family repetitive protein [Borreliella bavariensis]|nr:Bdr family repetitive protein [Borreliella bavariensis]